MILAGDDHYGTLLSVAEAQTQLSIWSIMASPLIMSSDLRTLKAEYKAVLLNKEMIKINQDTLGKAGVRVRDWGVMRALPPPDDFAQAACPGEPQARPAREDPRDLAARREAPPDARAHRPAPGEPRARPRRRAEDPRRRTPRRRARAARVAPALGVAATTTPRELGVW